MKSRQPNRSTDKTSTDSPGRQRPRSNRGTSKSRQSSSGSDRSPADSRLEKDQTEKPNAEKEPFTSNPYHRPDKFAEDYQDRHRRATIWNQGHEKFLSGPIGSSDPPSPESKTKKPIIDEKRHSGESQKRAKKPDARLVNPRNRPLSSSPSQEKSDKTAENTPTNISVCGRSKKSMGEESLPSAKGRHGEPITLAEEFALTGEIPEKELIIDSPNASAFLEELNRMTTAELIDLARKENLTIGKKKNRAELVVAFLRQRVRQRGFMFGEGTLEILPDSFGFLRSADHRYLSSQDDIYVSPSQIRRFGLRNGLVISGQIRPPKERERYFALLRVEAINHAPPQSIRAITHIEEMNTTTPYQRLYFCNESLSPNNSTDKEESLPSLFGNYLEVEVPESPGSELVINDWVKTIQKHHPDCYIFLISFSASKKEATDELSSPFRVENGESIVVKSDEQPIVQVHIAHILLEKAKRMVEFGRHVIVLIDSIANLIEAWNGIGVEKGESPEELENRVTSRLKRLTAWPRQIDQGGSYTIITTKRSG